MYLSRVAAVNGGLPVETPAFTVNRLCGSRLQAIVFAAQAIKLGDCDVAVAGGAVAGGAESMSRAHPRRQCNNIYIFPGVGQAVTAVRATRITDAMMTAAAAAVGDAATIRHDPHGTLLPDRAQLAGTATVVAGAVAKAAVADAVAPALTDDQIDQAIDRTRWLPRYQPDHRVVSR
jgi:malic enzyme